MDYVLVLTGLIGLFLGGEALVRGAVGLARRLSMSPLLIGLTVVGFGTSMPELLVSVDAALRGSPGIALGNVIGSNIANILLIGGVSALIWPIAMGARSLRRDTTVMVGSAVVLAPILAMGEIGRVAGTALLAGLAGYLVIAYFTSEPEMEDAAAGPAPSVAVSLCWGVGGLAALILGARFLVDGAVAVARDFGVSEAFIGLTIVAVGTSLPELATSLMAALRRQSEIAVGNIIGSNIFNVLGILGVTALISPVEAAPRFLRFDLPVAVAASVVLALLLLRPRVGRLAGAGLLVAYAIYVWAAQG